MAIELQSQPNIYQKLELYNWIELVKKYIALAGTNYHIATTLLP